MLKRHSVRLSSVVLASLPLAGCLSMQNQSTLDGGAPKSYVEAYIEYAGPQEKWAGPASFVLHIVAKDSGAAQITMTPPLLVDPKKEEGPTVSTRVPAAVAATKKEAHPASTAAPVSTAAPAAHAAGSKDAHPPSTAASAAAPKDAHAAHPAPSAAPVASNPHPAPSAAPIATTAVVSTVGGFRAMGGEQAREQLSHLADSLSSASPAFNGCMYPVRVRLVKSDGALVEKQGCRSETGWARAVSETVNLFINASVNGTAPTAVPPAVKAPTAVVTTL